LPTITVLGIIRPDWFVEVSGELVVMYLTNNMVWKVGIHPKKAKLKRRENLTATRVCEGIPAGTGKKFIDIVRGDYCGSLFVDDDET
jgi:hypothetical protein